MSDQVPFRGGGFAPKRVRGVGLVVFILLVAFAEWGTRSGWITSLTLPRPSDVLGTFVELWQSGALFKHLIPSLSRLAVGATMGAIVGIAVGVMIGLFAYVRAGLVPLVAAIFPIPKIALLPLFVIWFGIDETSKYALIALGTFTPTVVSTWVSTRPPAPTRTVGPTPHGSWTAALRMTSRRCPSASPRTSSEMPTGSTVRSPVAVS